MKNALKHPQITTLVVSALKAVNYLLLNEEKHFSECEPNEQQNHIYPQAQNAKELLTIINAVAGLPNLTGANFSGIISRETALMLLKPIRNSVCLAEQLGLEVMNKEYGKDNDDSEDYTGVSSEDYETLAEFDEYQTFEIWNNLSGTTVIRKEDVEGVAKTLGMRITTETIAKVMLRYDHEAEQDQTGSWYLIVENLLYQIKHENDTLPKIKTSFYKWGEFEEEQEILSIDLPTRPLSADELAGFVFRDEDADKDFFAYENDVDTDEEGTSVKRAWAVEPSQF